MEGSSNGNVVTVVRASNIHCNSCIQTINETLATLVPPPHGVEVSTEEKSVTVHHSSALPSTTIRDAIYDAGFDVEPDDAALPPYTPAETVTRTVKHLQQCTLCQQGGNLPSDLEKTGARAQGTHHVHASQSYQAVLAISGMTCSACSGSITRALEDIPGVTQVAVSVLDNSGTITIERKDLSDQVVEAIEDCGFGATLVELKPLIQTYQAVLAISGMTCSACSGSITRALEDIPGVTQVAVSVLDNSGTVTIARKDLSDKVVEAIEDCGFGATLVELKPLSQATKDSLPETSTRTITLQVDGLHSSQCPERVMSSLSNSDETITVITPLTNNADPFMTFSYDPKPPTFTIRQIIDAIETADPGYKVKIYHPPTLEERSRAIQLREQRRLLMRLAFATIVAIPTFILGIVYMALVSDHNPTRMYLMEPMWTGNASRVQWALFFMATPVMFYSAGLFHRRSIKEVHALWRKGSTVPIIKRFTRFGSMNLLVSAGVSVAYFASIVLLGLAAGEERDPNGHGDETSYFDSVVFLTMFLLAGRYLEAYSKSRTADAIRALASLRPTEALVVVPTAGSVPRESVEKSETSTIVSSHHGRDPEKADLFPTPSYSAATSSKGQRDPEKEDPYAPATSYSTTGTTVKKVSVELLEVGDVVRVLHGSTPPADGTIVDGETGLFDESSLTGESQPVGKSEGDKVFLGTINKGNVVHVRVVEIGGQTMLDQIVKVVREGQAKRAPVEKLADTLTAYFVPVITLLAIITWIIWLSLGLSGALPDHYLDNDVGGWTVWSLEFAIAVFVIACPCGIGLAAPTALLVGSGEAAKHGILARGGGEAFQEASRINTIVFDKTGTLTAGELQVTNELLCAADDWKDEVVLSLVWETENTSSHPLAGALQKYCAGKVPTMIPRGGSSFTETAGKGLKGLFSDPKCTVIIGNEGWMQDHGITLTGDVVSRTDTWKAEAKSTVFVGIGSESDDSYRLVAVFGIADAIRKEAPEVIAWFKKQGITPWMISGDHLKTALAVAAQVGIPAENVIAGVLPQGKGEKIQWLQQGSGESAGENERRIVAMVGDGINDSVALSLADVGIAIGSGSDVAVSSASFILLKSDLRSLLTLVDLSKAVIKRVKFNFLWAGIYNMAALPLAAGVIYPAGNTRLDPVWAALAMALS
ncbi:hypothetical protein PQX77_000113 [Marasmius sp. AFHP31]|nr:hypothetical protein PQX77_000113 [Marasmius sp. AFHP31]